MCKLNLKQNYCELCQLVEDPLAVLYGFDSRNIDGGLRAGGCLCDGS